MHENRLTVPAISPEQSPQRISQALAMAITGRSRRSVQRWIRRGTITDTAALLALQRFCHGLLPPPWAKCHIDHHSGALVLPDGVCVTLAEVRAARINAQLVAHLRAQLARTEAANAAMARELQQRPLERIQRAARALAGR